MRLYVIQYGSFVNYSLEHKIQINRYVNVLNFLNGARFREIPLQVGQGFSHF